MSMPFLIEGDNNSTLVISLATGIRGKTKSVIILTVIKVVRELSG